MQMLRVHQTKLLASIVPPLMSTRCQSLWLAPWPPDCFRSLVCSLPASMCGSAQKVPSTDLLWSTFCVFSQVRLSLHGELALYSCLITCHRYTSSRLMFCDCIGGLFGFPFLDPSRRSQSRSQHLQLPVRQKAFLYSVGELRLGLLCSRWR